jgi:hypothetical protein
MGISICLHSGYRGLPVGSSLARLLAKYRHVRNQGALPSLSIEQILKWADAEHQRTGRWPKNVPGPVMDAPGETWQGINSALRVGGRGLPGGLTLNKLLIKYCGKPRKRLRRPPLTIEQILAWADEHHRRTGKWPTSVAGLVVDAPGESWHGINAALRLSGRGLPAGLSLQELLFKYRGVQKKRTLPPPLTIKQILKWADAEHRYTGRWPRSDSGQVVDAPGETWRGINSALYSGHRGLPAGLSVRKLLIKYRGVRPPLTIEQILKWADAEHQRTGRWPQSASGPVLDVPDEKWSSINSALHSGCRGLPAGLSVRKLLIKYRGTPSPDD